MTYRPGRRTRTLLGPVGKFNLDGLYGCSINISLVYGGLQAVKAIRNRYLVLLCSYIRVQISHCWFRLTRPLAVGHANGIYFVGGERFRRFQGPSR